MEENQTQETQKMNFVHLHCHTEFSLLDGIARYKDLIKTCKKMGMSAVAVTDHGNMYIANKFFTECLLNDIKPIIGCEFYVAADYQNKTGRQKNAHLILLAKNNTGLKNLMNLDSIAYVDGFHSKPRIDYDLLSKYSEGLICMSACLAGDIPKYLLNNQDEEAENLALRLKNMFADGDFYIELQNHNLPEEKYILPKLDALAKKIGVKTVGTNDVHYIKQEDSELQDVLMCVQMQKTYDDPTRLKFGSQEFYLKTRDEMAEALSGFEDCLDTTVEIANKCDVSIKSKAHLFSECHKELNEKYILPAGQNFIPAFVNDEGIDNFEYLKNIAYTGLKERYPEINDELTSRLDFELETIRDLGFVEYFLIVWDYINYARSVDIPVGPGRGSGAGSIVAYTTGITDIDPIKYDLFFERFINKERVSMPDFDIDFCMKRRLEVVEYASRKYGADHVAHIVAFGTMASKNAIKDVGRVLRVPYFQTDKLSKLIPNKLPDGIKKPPVLKYYLGISGEEGKEKYINEELRKMYDSDDNIKKVLTIAAKIEGCPRNTTTHACGVLIAPERIANITPLQRNGEDITTQVTGPELEQLGLLKMDFLGLRTLTDIQICLDMIKEDSNRVINFKELGVDDPKVYELISTGNTDTIFQIESGGFKKYLKDLKPDCLEDIIAAVSLYRPGPMESFPTYIKNKHHPEYVTYDSPILEPILNVTYGCIVYQEQVMKIVQAMGGYSLGQADNVRRIMGKKKVEKMAAEKQKFIYGYKDPTGKHNICGAINKGVSEEVASKVFSKMEKFASYAFNKSHAAAYSHVTYQTAWLKTYYPVHWLAAFLNNRITDMDKVKKYLAYSKTQNIEVLSPNINKSKTYFSVEDNGIRYGMSALKGVGIGICEEIVEERNTNGDFKDIVDFVERLSGNALNKRLIESMIFSGAFDCFGKKRSQLIAVYDNVIARAQADKKNEDKGQFSLWGMLDEKDQQKMSVNYPDITEFSTEAKLKYEKECLGAYMSGHPLDKYTELLKTFNLNSSMLIGEEVPIDSGLNDDGDDEADEMATELVYENIENGQRVKCGGVINDIKKVTTKLSGKDMAIVTIEDLYGSFEIMLFPAIFAKFRDNIAADDLVTISGKVSIRDGENAIILVDNISPMSAVTPDQKDALTTVNMTKKEETMYLLADMTDEKLKTKLLDILSHNIGETKVIIKCSTTKKAYKSNIKVRPGIYLLNELKAVLPSKNIVIK